MIYAARALPISWVFIVMAWNGIDRASAQDAAVQPAAAEPAAQPTAPSRSGSTPTAESGAVNVELRTLDAGVTFHLVRGPGPGLPQQRLCGQSCTLRLVPGSYVFALSEGTGEPIESGTPTRIEGPSIVEGAYDSAENTRLLGSFVLASGVIAGLSTTALGIALIPDSSSEEVAVGSIIGGTLTIVLSTVIGLIIASDDDEVQIDVRPSFLVR